MNPTKKHTPTVYLLGIGGAGMSALAELLHGQGVSVAGCDRAESDHTRRLLALGIPVDITNRPDAAEGAGMCVYSAAFDQKHPQLIFAKKRMPVFSRGEMMGRISRDFSTVAAVAGTHGKTTVCSLLTYILLLDGKDPSALLGGTLTAMGGNGRMGSRELLICEACEYAGSFLPLKRDLGILLNIDNDHLECFGSMEGLTKVFGRFAAPCHRLLVFGQDPTAMEITREHPRRFCFGQGKDMDFALCRLWEKKGFYTFTMRLQDQQFPPICLKIPGRHNVTNALAAAAAARLLGASHRAIVKGLSTFTGAARRFEILSTKGGITLADDYAHHPAEITSVLDSARNMGFQKITAVFQPFTFSRTKALHREFARALSAADRVILSPIMGGREKNDGRVSSYDIARHIPGCVVCGSLADCGVAALAEAVPGELILTMGCGNIYQCARQMACRLEKE